MRVRSVPYGSWAGSPAGVTAPPPFSTRMGFCGLALAVKLAQVQVLLEVAPREPPDRILGPPLEARSKESPPVGVSQDLGRVELHELRDEVVEPGRCPDSRLEWIALNKVISMVRAPTAGFSVMVPGSSAVAGGPGGGLADHCRVRRGESNVPVSPPNRRATNGNSC